MVRKVIRKRTNCIRCGEYKACRNAIYGFVCYKCLEPDDVVLCSECGKPKRYGLFPVLRSADGHIIRKSFCDECNRKLGRHKYKKPRKNKNKFHNIVHVIKVLESLYIVDNIEEPVNVKKDQSGKVIINMKDVMKVFARSELNPKLLTETEKELYKSVLRGKWEVL